MMGAAFRGFGSITIPVLLFVIFLIPGLEHASASKETPCRWGPSPTFSFFFSSWIIYASSSRFMMFCFLKDNNGLRQ